MSEFILTFGCGHHDERNGSLENCCTRIEGVDEIEARLKIAAVRGKKWASCYPKEEGEKMIRRYGVREIHFSEIGPQIGENL